MAPFVPRRRYHREPGQGLAALHRALAGGGRATSARAALEAALSARHEGRHAVATASGRAALLLTLDALGLAPGDEILVPAYTLGALVDLLAARGFVPVPVDLEPAGFGMDPAHAAARVGPRTRAILATHLFGTPCDLGGLGDLARARGLWLVEDAAQAAGATWRGRPVGAIGDAAIHSFDRLKMVGAWSGGAALLADPSHAAHVRAALVGAPAGLLDLARQVVETAAEDALLASPLGGPLARLLAHPRLGAWMARAYRAAAPPQAPLPAPLDEGRSAAAQLQLASLDRRVAARRALARRLADALGEPPPTPDEPRQGNGYFFVRLARGDAGTLRRDLIRAGFDAGTGHEVADLCADKGRADACPRARDAARRAIQLPLHEGMGEREVARLAARCRGRLDPA